VSPHTLLFHRVLSCLAGTEFATLEDPPPVQPERPVLSSQLQGVNSKHAIPQLPQCSTMCALACIPTRLHSQACLRQTCAAPCRFAKGVLAGVVPWCEARRFFAWRLKRRLTEEGLIRHISSTDVSISRLDAIAMVRRMACAVWGEGRVCAVSFRGGGGLCVWQNDFTCLPSVCCAFRCADSPRQASTAKASRSRIPPPALPASDSIIAWLLLTPYQLLPRASVPTGAGVVQPGRHGPA
jgi:hypothetical protein